MRISRIFLSLTLGASCMLMEAQENKDAPQRREREPKSAPAERPHTRQAEQGQHERQAAPVERQHSQPQMQRQAPEQPRTERQDRPARPPQVQQSQPNNNR